MSDLGPVLCFGEALWDSLPRGLFPGGAPMNVACHLARRGIAAEAVTAVGDDPLGEELLRRLSGAGVGTRHVARLRDRPTGLVRVALGAGGPSYEILRDAAWERIAGTPALEAEAARASALVFGSLAQREPHNRALLARLRALSPGALHVLDANLRAPHDSPERVLALAEGVGLLKVNDGEAARLLGDASGRAEPEPAARALAARTGAPRVCVTAGAAGAGLLAGGRWHWEAGRPIDPIDTVGAGDAFLASLLADLLAGDRRPGAVLARACRLAEFVAGREGAVPAYSVAADGAIVPG